ncbi:unnamed protein product [Symbiodinium sp. CCMP2592]|nr:unnamed protein product [Symbiodinium sp. CCMP2592]
MPRCLPDASQHNNRLLAWAYERATTSCVPAIVGGDFNVLPQDLPAWSAFAQQGWMELGEFVATVHNIELPCTCKGATRFDTFLLPPCLLQFFHNADVLEDCHLFDSHAPMRLHLRVPGPMVPRWIWPAPKTFTDLLRQTSDLEEHYVRQAHNVRPVFGHQVPENQDGDQLRLWAATVEEAVHTALQQQNRADPTKQPVKGLPTAYRGRCRQVDRKVACPPRLPRAGRNGDPEPFDEDTTVLGRQRLRQLRRLVTFRQGYLKHQAGTFKGAYSHDGWPVSLHREWQAITKAPGYGRTFPSWVLQWPCFLTWPTGFPPLPYLEDLISFVRFDVEALNRQQAKMKNAMFRFKLDVDEKDYGCSKTFARIRPPSKPPFHSVQVQSCQEVQTCCFHSHQLRSFHVPDATKFDLLCQVFYCAVPGQVTAKQGNEVTVLFPQDDDVVLPLRGQLVRSRKDCSWQGVVGALMDYWHPIWNRDTRAEEADISHWSQFSTLLHRLHSPCPPFEVNMLDAQAWQHALDTGPLYTGAKGLSLDLLKAFNFLPRCPIAQAMIFLGVPIDGSLSAGLPSTTGAPEGDPVSVLAMLGICFVFVSALSGLVQARTYMDNWTWSTDMPDCHGPALLVLQDLTEGLRLEVDWGKTYVWGTQPVSRTWWRDIGPTFLPDGLRLPVVSHVRELGSFLQFSRKPVRTGFTDRTEDAIARLGKLAKDPQSLKLKARVLQGGIWPFLFFGTEGLSPCLTSMQKLRGHAARALVGNHHTVSPHAALYLSPGATDPEVYLLGHHLRQLRRMADLFPSLARQVWHRLITVNPSQRSVCGPAGALQILLHRNNWVPKADGWCKGPLHCAFHVFRTPPQQIQKAVQQAWADEVQNQVLHRAGLQRAPAPDAITTHKALRTFKPWEQRILLRHVAGGFMSGAEKASWSREDHEHCPLCGQQDTKAHRVFECQPLDAARQEHQTVLQQVQGSCPYWTHMTFAPLPSEAPLLKLILQGLKLPPLASPAAAASQLCLFTDGSAQYNNTAQARVATWAVIRADPEWKQEIANGVPGAQTAGFQILAQGCVPGEQSVPRAELSAIIWAAAWASQTPCTVDIYADCQPAIDAWEEWHREGFPAVRHRAFADLFHEVSPARPCTLHKVKAHRTAQEVQQMSTEDRWATYGNEAADSAAKAAFASLPDYIKDTAQQVASHCDHHQGLLHSFCRALVDIGVLDIKLRGEAKKVQLPTPTDASDQLQHLLERYGRWQVPSGTCQLPDVLELDWAGWSFGQQFGENLLDWMRVLVWPTLPVPVSHDGQVSFLELLFHFVWTTRAPPLVQHRRQNDLVYIPLPQALDALLPCGIPQLVTIFKAALKQLGQRYNFRPWPGLEVKAVPHLRWLGVTFASPGLSVRPTMPGNWLSDFQWMCQGDMAHRIGSFCDA